MEKIFVGYNCLQCFVEQIDKVLKLSELNEEKKIDIYLKSLKFLSEIEDFNCSPPEIARQVYEFLYKITGNNNPFKKLKEETNKIAEDVFSKLILSLSSLNLEDFIKFAVAGNIVDFGVGKSESSYNSNKLMNILQSLTIDINDFSIFEKNLGKCKNLLYILDNSGEAVFDKKLLEKLKELYSNMNIFTAARNDNIINDISVEDAFNMGFDSIGDVISTGYSGPGVLIEKTSNEFRKIFNQADIIVAKGQGNFETLWGEKKNIFYALKIKCSHVAEKSGFKLNSNLFICGLNYD